MISRSTVINIIFVALIVLATLLILYLFAQVVYASFLRLHTTFGMDLLLIMRSRSSTVSSTPPIHLDPSQLTSSVSGTITSPGGAPFKSVRQLDSPKAVTLLSSADDWSSNIHQHHDQQSHATGPGMDLSSMSEPTISTPDSASGSLTGLSTTSSTSSLLFSGASFHSYSPPPSKAQAQGKVSPLYAGTNPVVPLRRIKTNPMFKLANPPKPIGFKLEDIFCKEVLQKPLP